MAGDFDSDPADDLAIGGPGIFSDVSTIGDQEGGMLVLLADGDEPGDNKTLFYSDDELQWTSKPEIALVQSWRRGIWTTTRLTSSSSGYRTGRSPE